MENYKQLETVFGDIVALSQISSVISWDKSVLLPEDGMAQRGKQAAVLSAKIHEMLTVPKVGDLIAKVDRNALDEWQKANLALIERQYKKATGVPSALIEKRIIQEAKTESLWRKAREESNFAMVQSELEKMLDVTREIGAAEGKVLGVSAYDAMIDSYAPYMTSAEVDVIFDDLAAFIPSFLDEVLKKQAQNPPLPLQGAFSVVKQVTFCHQLARLLGFDFKWGRLDVSAHPFSTGIGGDVRITTRYDEGDFTSAIQCVAHETGHGLYDHHTPAEWQAQPVGRSQNMGMAIHESQSLSLDMQLGRSREFWTFLAPYIQTAFDKKSPEMSGENLYRLATQVERNFIRISADEITYLAHIILRYRLEKAMVEGKLAVKDLPEAWNAQMKELIGVTPSNDKQGCLQDIHWYCGDFGYFPAYAIGAMIAAQMVEKMRQDIPDISQHILEGRFGVFTGWLRETVQVKACLYTPQQLIEKTTGEKLSARAIKAHLQRRYLEKN